jgi:hypothetical protein
LRKILLKFFNKMLDILLKLNDNIIYQG